MGLALACCLLGASGKDLSAQFAPPRPGGLYGSAGVGFLNLERGFGMSIPLGLTAVSSSYRFIGSASLLDIGLLQGDDRDPRYARTSYGSSRRLGCVDTQSGYLVSNFRCSSGTDALHSFSVDLSYVAVENLWLGGRSGQLFTGLGYRLLNPQTPYGTVGMYFDSRNRVSSGFKVAFGKGYVFFGLLWGYRTKGR
jgi:hypothetical protein